MIILRQKQYSPGFSGIKQVLKKNIDSARMKLAEKLDKSIEKDLIEKKKLENEGKKLSISLHNHPRQPSLVNPELEAIEKKGRLKINRGTDNLSLSGNTLNLPKSSVSVGELNHEVGHARNASGENGPIAKFIYDHGQTNKTLNEMYNVETLGMYPESGKKEWRHQFEDSTGYNEFLESPKLSDSIGRFVRGRLLVRDEKNASRWSIKRLKKLLRDNPDPELLAKEAERQRIANQTYEKSVSISSKLPLRNRIQVPRERGNLNYNINDKVIADKS